MKEKTSRKTTRKRNKGGKEGSGRRKEETRAIFWACASMFTSVCACVRVRARARVCLCMGGSLHDKEKLKFGSFLFCL